jgi:hypothetical protein
MHTPTGKSDHQAERVPFRSEFDRVVARLHVDWPPLHHPCVGLVSSATVSGTTGTTVGSLATNVYPRWSSGYWNEPCVPSSP